MYTDLYIGTCQSINYMNLYLQVFKGTLMVRISGLTNKSETRHSFAMSANLDVYVSISRFGNIYTLHESISASVSGHLDVSHLRVDEKIRHAP